MKFVSKKIISLVLAALMITLAVTPASAITATRASTVKNDGRRDVNATALSEQAITYYTDEVQSYITGDSTSNSIYAAFEALSTAETNDSSDSWTVAQGNSLYTALYNIMSTTHTHGVSYASYGDNSLANYWLTTDTSVKDSPDGRTTYTLFYSDEVCYNHENMQREHIWPKSQASFHKKTGLGGSDLHHLRPAYGKVNNIKSNWGFGEVQQWSNARQVAGPSSDNISLWRADIYSENTTFVDVKKDVRGDVARILLYVYTRWQQPNLYSDVAQENLPELDSDDSKDEGKKVIQSLDVLLKWMKEDPVSEWEMKRNDLTEDIQGNRNVFIDYPELAWLMFDQTVPSDMVTPSGMAKGTGTDIAKAAEPKYTDPVTLDIGFTASSNGKAEITAYDNTTGKYVKNGGKVERGDSITYTVIPDGATIGAIREYRYDASDGKEHYSQLAKPDSAETYTFERKAGYHGETSNGCDKEKITITLTSNVCEISYKIVGLTATGGSNGSGSGMVTATATIDGKQTLIENGDTVPNGTEVTFTFTPDYGSRFDHFSHNSQRVVTKIEGTESYTYTELLEQPTGTTRTETFKIYFAATFSNASNSPDKDKHINTKGMRPDEGDAWRDETDFTRNFEICGVQIKNVEGEKQNKALRFVSVIDQEILDKAESYGYVIGFSRQTEQDSKTINRNAYNLVKDGAYGLTVDCTGTDNNVFGDYGKHNTTTNYKYVTAAVNNLQEMGGNGTGLDATIIARPYVVLKPEYRATDAPSVIYGEYVDFSSGESFCACSGSFNYIQQQMESGQ